MRFSFWHGDAKICGRNDGGPLYYLKNFRDIFGAENVSHNFPHKAYDLNLFGKYDYHILIDWGEDALNMQDFELPHPSIYVPSDTHLGYEYRLSRARRCDYVFCCQKNAVDDFIRDGIPADRIWWLPHAFDPLAYSPGVFNERKNQWDVEAEGIKKYDVCFIGNLNDENRVRHLDRLFKEFPNFYYGNQRFHEAAEKFNQSRIVFNVSARGELNMRMFEALGTRSLLLSDTLLEGRNVFTPEVHFAGYATMDEMVEKAHFYLENQTMSKQIAQHGYELACSQHTYLHRSLKMLDTLKIPYEQKRVEELIPRQVLVEA